MSADPYIMETLKRIETRLTVLENLAKQLSPHQPDGIHTKLDEIIKLIAPAE